MVIPEKPFEFYYLESEPRQSYNENILEKENDESIDVPFQKFEFFTFIEQKASLHSPESQKRWL